MSTFTQKLHHYLRAAYPFLWVETFEESRLCNEVGDFYLDDANKMKGKPVNVFVWDIQTGLRQRTGVEEYTDLSPAETKSHAKILEYIGSISKDGNCVFMLKDFHPYIEAPGIIRQLRNLKEQLTVLGKMLIFVSPVVKVPVELTKEIQFLDFALPDEKAIEAQLEFIKDSCEKKLGTDITIDPKLKQEAIVAAKGMTESESQNSYSLAIIEHGKFESAFVTSVFQEKIEKIKKNGLLQYIAPSTSFGEVGGLAELKKWIKVRSKAYSPEARAFGLPYPKGIMLCGYPGTGKTLIAKATSAELNVPLFQLDVGGLFGKHVGETEANFRRVVQTVDAIGPCILFIDEIEKALNKDAVSGKGDTGTSSRSFGTLLSWMNDRTSPVFVIGTSNNFTILPPELIRKGRFDELFWISLPSAVELEEIFSVVLKKYKRIPASFDLKKLAKATKGWTGAEVDLLVQAALFNCFAKGEPDITTARLLDEAAEMTPQSETNKVQYEEMANTARGKLRMAAVETATSKADKAFRSIEVYN